MSNAPTRDEEAVTVALAGDATITRRISNHLDPDESPFIQQIRGADVGLINLEVPVHNYEGYPSANSGGTYLRGPPLVADELAWAGFDMYAAASNHSGDYSFGGMQATMRELETRGIPYAGLGRNLADARSPAYYDSPAGRVGLVAACSTVTPGTDAGPQGTFMQGRPGISPLKLNRSYEVPEDVFGTLETMSEELGLEARKERMQELNHPSAFEEPEDELAMLDVIGGDGLDFTIGSDYGVTLEPDSGDVEAITQHVRDADRQADWVVASIHSHEGASGRRNDQSVPTFLETVAHECVAAGADVVFGHGSHRLRGIEIYEETPIFYSLGNFVMQIETVTQLPPEMYEANGLPPDSLPADLFDKRVYDENGEPTGILTDRSFWDSIVPVCHYAGGEIAKIELHPIVLGQAEPRARRGVPRPATPDDAQRIFDSIESLSAPYGTTITVHEDHASIEL